MTVLPAARIAASFGMTVLVCTACTTASQNFQDQTEEFLERSGSVSSSFDDAAVSDAACERPDGTAVGTTYRCTATVAGVGTVRFVAQIVAEDEFSVAVDR
ncbi:MAG: hypothetical protein AAGG08_15360 [Actinomycetota bacterium]